MLKLSKMTDYAVVLLEPLSRTDTPQSAPQLARMTHLPEPTVSKILKILTRADILNASRGAQGGYLLNKSADALTIREIIEALEGPIALTACADSQKICDLSASCALNGRWAKVNAAMVSALDSVTLQQMAGR